MIRLWFIWGSIFVMNSLPIALCQPALTIFESGNSSLTALKYNTTQPVAKQMKETDDDILNPF